MKTKLILIVLIIGSIHSSHAQQKEFSWLIGKWKLADKNIYEIWKLGEDAKSLEGVSFRIKNADTTVTEQIKIVFKNGAFHYVPDVAGDQGAVDFKISRHTSDSFVAENPQHDFPKIIRYKLIRKDNADFIEASIEGNGKVIPYSFERLK
jgi:hypothetical protein